MSFSDFLNRVWYLWKRNSWMVDPRFYLDTFGDVTIDRPIFFLGNQGGGLTLISRMLRRHPAVVSVTGNHHYWSGADEMHNVFELALPSKIGGTQFKAPPHPVLTPTRSWSYATDELFHVYRQTENDVDPSSGRALRRVIRYCLGRYAPDSPGGTRFLDKSQVFTVRLGLIWKILEDCKPRFVLITRNPYAACFRSARGKAVDLSRYKQKLTFDERLELTIQHWRNAMSAVMEDVERLGLSVPHYRFEDFLRHPEERLRELCDSVELSFDPSMLPQEHQTIPFGSRFHDRWYPLRPEVNEKYFRVMDREHVERIQKGCGELAELFGYEPPTFARPTPERTS